MVRSVCESCSMWMPMEQTRSRMCPWLWVGKFTCWVRLKQLSISRKSVVALESMSILKSPRSKMDEEMRDSWVKKSEKSDRKDGLGVGGTVDDSNDDRFWAGEFYKPGVQKMVQQRWGGAEG